MSWTLAAAAVLFDNDGVLVDSDAASRAAWGAWAEHHGLLAEDVIRGGMGRRSGDTVALHVPTDAVADGLALIERLEIETAGATRALPGAVALMASVRDEARAVVTSGTLALASARLRAAGVPIPTVLVTAELVTRGKPHPDPFLLAAERLGAPPAACIVLEDSANGIRAARAAGVGAVVGVSATALGQGCDAVIADLSGVRWTGSGLELLEVLERA